MNRSWDVVVAGAGSAGLSAAVAAREAGSERVLLIDKGAPGELGGNARFSGGLFLFAHAGTGDVARLIDLDPDTTEVEPYPAEAYVDELESMSGGTGDAALFERLVADSLDTMTWLRANGVRFAFGHNFGVFVRDGVLRVPSGPALEAAGGGPGLVTALLAAAERAGAVIAPRTGLVGVERDGTRLRLSVEEDGTPLELDCGALVVATGGFAGDPDRRRRHLGEEWAHAAVRGTRHNTGDGIQALLDAGAAAAGDWSRCHAAAIDANAPTPDVAGTSPTHLRGFWLGIVVDKRGQRFVDEGADRWLKVYSRLGRAILERPDGEAFEIFDAKTSDRVARTMVEAAHSTAEPVVADTIPELAERLGLPADALVATVDAFNASVSDVPFDPDVLDGKATRGLEPPKSNWAAPIDTPPFTGYRARCGITFTHGGVRIDGEARVLDGTGTPLPGLFAAGETTGGFFYGDYPGGSSLMRSTVFGRRGGANAAAAARAAQARPARA